MLKSLMCDGQATDSSRVRHFSSVVSSCPCTATSSTRQSGNTDALHHRSPLCTQSIKKRENKISRVLAVDKAVNHFKYET